MKKQTVHKPNDQQTSSETITALASISQSSKPIYTEAKTKSNDGGYIWIVWSFSENDLINWAIMRRHFFL